VRTLELIAPQVGGLSVRVGVVATVGQREDMVDRERERVHVFAADATLAVVSFQQHQRLDAFNEPVVPPRTPSILDLSVLFRLTATTRQGVRCLTRLAARGKAR